MGVNYIDLIIIVPVLIGLYKGYSKGLILSVATLIGLIAGVWIGVKFSHITAKFLFEKFQIDIPLLSFAVTFLVIVIGMYFLGKALSKFAKLIALGFINNLGGAIFGAGKSILILAVVLLFFETVNENIQVVETKVLDESILYTYLKSTSDLVFPYLNDLKKVNPVEIPTSPLVLK